MTLIKYNPHQALRAFDFDNVVRSFFNNSWFNEDVTGSWIPAVDISENENGYKIEMELPGMSKEDVNIAFEEKVLRISGEKKIEQKNDNDNCHRLERRYGKFERNFRINSEVITDKINAVFKNGVLSIDLPKAEIAKPKSIDIKVK